MDDLEQIEEEWCTIEDFPDYEVSSTGLVMNSDTNRILRTSKTAQGAIKVGLMGFDGKQHTRSVKVLVADAFVGGRDEIFNTPINLDGDQTNCAANNLVWRPRGFSMRYYNELQNIRPEYLINPVRDITGLYPEDYRFGVVYDNVHEAATKNGLIMSQVYASVWHNTGHPHPDMWVFPTHQKFVYAINPQT